MENGSGGEGDELTSFGSSSDEDYESGSLRDFPGIDFHHIQGRQAGFTVENSLLAKINEKKGKRCTVPVWVVTSLVFSLLVLIAVMVNWSLTISLGNLAIDECFDTSDESIESTFNVSLESGRSIIQTLVNGTSMAIFDATFGFISHSTQAGEDIMWNVELGNLEFPTDEFCQDQPYCADSCCNDPDSNCSFSRCQQTEGTARMMEYLLSGITTGPNSIYFIATNNHYMDARRISTVPIPLSGLPVDFVTSSSFGNCDCANTSVVIWERYNGQITTGDWGFLINYLPSARGWYKNLIAIGNESIANGSFSESRFIDSTNITHPPMIWSSPYFYLSGFIGMDFAGAIYKKVGNDYNLLGVAGGSLILNDINSFLSDQPTGESGVAFIVETLTGRLIASSSGNVSGWRSPTGEWIVDRERCEELGVDCSPSLLERIPAVEAVSEIVRNASIGLISVGQQWDLVPQNIKISWLESAFKGTDNFVFVTSRILQSNGLSWVTVVAMSENDFLSDVKLLFKESEDKSQRAKKDSEETINILIAITLTTSLISTVLAVVASIIISLCISRPIVKLNNQIDQLASLEWAKSEKKTTKMRNLKRTMKNNLVGGKKEKQHWRAHRSRYTEIFNIQSSFSVMRTAIEAFGRFVPKAVVKRIVKGDKKSTQLHVATKEVTLLFSDIAKFTTIAEKTPPKTLMILMGDYLGAMVDEIESMEGTIGDFIGDGIMAFWNSPEEVEDHPIKACTSALNQQLALKLLNQQWKESGINTCEWSVRIGIHTGLVLTGNIGSVEKMKFGCVGDSVNTASRLENTNKFYGTDLLISHTTYSQVEDYFICRPIDKVVVKGKSEPIILYELMADVKGATKDVVLKADMFWGIWNSYQERDFKKAKTKIYQFLERFPDDKPALKILEYCKIYNKNPPGKNWKGAVVLDEK